MKRSNFLTRSTPWLLFIAALASLHAPLFAAEFEIIDKLVVGGPATLKSSTTLKGATSAGYIASSSQTLSGQLTVNSTVTILAPDGNLLGASLWASTSTITPHLYVSTMGSVGMGTAAPSAKLHVQASGVVVDDVMRISSAATAGIYSISVSSIGVTRVNNLVIENRSSDPPLSDRTPGRIWLIYP